MWHLPIWCNNYQSDERIKSLPRLAQFGYGHAINCDYYNSGKLRTDKPHWIFQFTKKGYGIFRNQESEQLVSEGKGFLCNPLNPNIEYFYPDGMSGSWEFYFIAFEGGDEIFSELTQKYGEIFELSEKSSFIAKLLPKQQLELHTQLLHHISGKEAVDYALEFINLLLDSKSINLCKEKSKETIVNRAKSLINSNKNKKISVNFLAEMLGVTPEHLARAFKNESNHGPHHYIIEARLQRATELLRSSNLKIKEIAYKCGFDSPRDFNRTFLKVLKETPSQFRKTH